MGAANNINVVQTVSVRGTLHQTDTGLLWVPPGVRIWGPSTGPGVSTYTTFREGIWVRAHELTNQSGQTSVVGIGGRIANRYWLAGKWTDSSTTYTDYTTNAQGTTTAVDLDTNATNNDGFVILSLVPFNWISLNCTQAETGTAPTHILEYSLGATWSTTFTPLNATVAARTINGTTLWTTGEVAAIWSPPTDWAASLSGLGTNIPAGYYAMRMRASTAPGTTRGQATGIEIGLARILPSLANGSIWEVDVEDYWMPQADGLIACNFPAAGTTYTMPTYAEVGSR